MKKVLCVNAGDQRNDYKVVVGNTYTVIGIVEGWEVMSGKGLFYRLIETGSICVYWEGLFSDLAETELELVNEKQLVNQ